MVYKLQVIIYIIFGIQYYDVLIESFHFAKHYIIPKVLFMFYTKPVSD